MLYADFTIIELQTHADPGQRWAAASLTEVDSPGSEMQKETNFLSTFLHPKFRALWKVQSALSPK